MTDPAKLRSSIDAGRNLLVAGLPTMPFWLRVRVWRFLVMDSLVWGPLHRLCVRLSGRLA